MLQRTFRNVASLFAVALLAAACGVGPAHNARTLAGSVTGLKGTGLVLQFNGGADITVDPSATTFKFDYYTADGWSYEVTVLTQPTNPSQTCKVENGSGTTNGADVTSVEVICTTNTYTVGVSVSRLLGNGAGLVLQLNDAEELPVAVAGKFAFSSKIESGATYTVKVAQHPTNPAQTCSVSGGSGTGTVGGADVTDVAVTCTIRNTYLIGGSVSGLLGNGAGLVLQLNNGEKIDVVREGKFTFSGKLESGATYAVAVAQQPTNPAQTCSVSAGSGTVHAADVDSIDVDCSGNPFSVGFSVQGLAGSGLEVALNGAEKLSVKNSGAFSFETKLVGAATYDVTVTQQPTNPSQTCSPERVRGTGNGTNVAGIAIVCSSTAYTIGGTVTGLTGTGLVLQLNSQYNLALTPSDVNFSFGENAKVASGSTYSITVLSDPTGPAQTCFVSNGNGKMADANIGNVSVACFLSGTVSTLAGLPGQPGAVDKTGAEARFNSPSGVAVDAKGNILVADSGSHTIRKITPEGAVSTLAGATGQQGAVDKPGTEARFSSPAGIAVDAKGNILVADSGSHTIRKITPEGDVSTLAGAAGKPGTIDNPGAEARFNSPQGVAVDAKGNVFVADSGNNTIRKITPEGAVSTLAGAAGQSGAVDMPREKARFNWPFGVAVDVEGNVFVADLGNHAIRKISPEGVVSTLAGTADQPGAVDKAGAEARFNSPRGIAVDDFGVVYVAEYSNHTIRKIASNGDVGTLAGTAGETGSVDKVGAEARFNRPAGVAVGTHSIVYVAEKANHTIRRIVQ
jgi:sugar lactone lactonase YvrE